MTLVWRPGWNGLTEPEAVEYVAAVEAADGQDLEFGVAKAINDFVLGCKNDGIWSAIKASCILAGARTLDGALVPLVGAAPTSFNFESSDYSRETGLAGDASTKYLDTNRNNNADPQNSKHISVYVSQPASGAFLMDYIGAGDNVSGGSRINTSGTTNRTVFRLNNASTTIDNIDGTVNRPVGFYGASRAASGSYSTQVATESFTASTASTTPLSQNIEVFRRTTGANYTDARIAFYSIGESVNLSLLNTRVTDLMTAIGAAIP